MLSKLPHKQAPLRRYAAFVLWGLLCGGVAIPIGISNGLFIAYGVYGVYGPREYGLLFVPVIVGGLSSAAVFALLRRASPVAHFVGFQVVSFLIPLVIGAVPAALGWGGPVIMDGWAWILLYAFGWAVLLLPFSFACGLLYYWLALRTR